MRYVWLMPVVCVFAAQAAVQSSPPPANLLAHGARDGDAPAWAITVASPAGWTRDCCVYASAIGVDAVLYQGAVDRRSRKRVMVLNVSPRKLPTLAEEVQADRKHFLQSDPTAKITDLAVQHKAMPCEATVYQGSDHVNDVVVFCDPGQTSGVRVSWSMTFDDGDPMRRALLDDFMQVVVASRYVRYVNGFPKPPGIAGTALCWLRSLPADDVRHVTTRPCAGNSCWLLCARWRCRSRAGCTCSRWRGCCARVRRRRCWHRRVQWRAVWW